MANQDLMDELEANREWVEEDIDPSSWSWLDEVLDVNFITRANGEFVGAELVLCTGGPHIELRTDDARLDGWWGSDRASLDVDSRICEQMDEVLREYHESMRECNLR